MKLNHIIILQNKVDLMREEAAEQHYQSILKFIRGTIAQYSPVVPCSAVRAPPSQPLRYLV
jgi:translation initiation factor 2 subunit 3